MQHQSSNVEKIVVDDAVFRLSIVWSVPEIFAIKVYSCPRSSALLITHEPLHLAYRSNRTLLNFKVKGQGHGFLVFFCVHYTAATRGQYLALSKAWWSYLMMWMCLMLDPSSLQVHAHTSDHILFHNDIHCFWTWPSHRSFHCEM